MNTLAARQALLADLDAIHEIETTVFAHDRLPRRSLRRFLLTATTDAVVVHADETVVGYAMIGFRRTSRIGRLFSLAAARGEGRRGIGRMLLTACEEAAWRRGCDAVRLEVRADNAAAIALYRGAGYAAEGEWSDYYEDGGTALRFAKARPGAA